MVGTVDRDPTSDSPHRFGQPRLEADSVSIQFHRATGGSSVALADVSFRVNEGEFVSIVGPSGCGKSTLLNIAGGLLRPTQGSFRISGVNVAGPGPDRAMVFQDASLLPWRNVLDNVLFGIQCQGRDVQRARQPAQDLIELVGLHGFEKHYPHELSGGMRQRVNLARALLTQPAVFLMDEPFAALDAQTRELMQAELLRIWGEFGGTVLFVTHQIDEAVYLSDRVIVLSRQPGRIVADLAIEGAPRPRTIAMKREEPLMSYERHIWELIVQNRQ
jgi:NitT/TauT family transport system ATP-binding protein